MKENKEDNTKNIYLSQRAEILSQTRRESKRGFNYSTEQTTKMKKISLTENRNIEV